MECRRSVLWVARGNRFNHSQILEFHPSFLALDFLRATRHQISHFGLDWSCRSCINYMLNTIICLLCFEINPQNFRILIQQCLVFRRNWLSFFGCGLGRFLLRILLKTLVLRHLIPGYTGTGTHNSQFGILVCIVSCSMVVGSLNEALLSTK